MAEIPDQTTSVNGSGESGNRLPVTPVVITPEKRGRGRPPGSGNRPKETVQKSENPRGRSEDSALLDPAVIGDLFVSLSEIGDDLVVILIMGRARTKLTERQFELFRGEVSRIRLGEKDKRLIKEAGIALAKKYPFLQKWGPEIILLICGVQYSARMGNCLRQINALPDMKVEKSPIAQPSEKPDTAPVS